MSLPDAELQREGCTCLVCPHCGSEVCYYSKGDDSHPWVLRCGNTDLRVPNCPLHEDRDGAKEEG